MCECGHHGGHECGCGHHRGHQCGCGRHHHGGCACGGHEDNCTCESDKGRDCGCDEGHGSDRERGCHEHHHGEEHGPRAGFQRRYMTKEEEIAHLEPYLRDLQAEVKAVEERLAALRASA